MTASRSVLSWIPALAVGATMATSAEICGILLLYSGSGFLRALSLILVVEAGSVALGLWVAAGVGRPRVVEAIRRRWLFALTVVSAATVTAVAWSLVGGFADSRLGQGLGLAALGGLPLYATGTLAGLVVKPQAGLAPDPGSRWPGPAVLLVAGLAVGFLVTGALLRIRLTPASIFLGTVVLLSAGALVHGRFLRPDPLVREVEEIRSGGGVFRVEDRVALDSGEEARVLFVNGRVRGLEGRDGRPLLTDERSVLATVAGSEPAPRAALVLGVGAGTLVRGLVGRVADVRVVGLEEDPEVLRLAREHFPDLAEDDMERVTLMGVDPRRLGRLGRGAYDLVLMDASAADRGRPAPLLSSSEARDLRRLVARGGRLVIFRLPDRDEAAESLAALVGTLADVFSRAELVEPPTGTGGSLDALGLEPPPSTLLLATVAAGREDPMGRSDAEESEP